MDSNAFAKLKGLPIEEATDIHPEQIKGIKPKMQLSRDGQNIESTFAVGKAN